MRGALLDKFIAQQNIANWRRQLECGAGGDRRDAMLRLLVPEEDKLGLSHEQLEMDRQIAQRQQLVSTQLELIAALKSHGRSVERAECALSTTSLTCWSCIKPAGRRLSGCFRSALSRGSGRVSRSTPNGAAASKPHLESVTHFGN